MDNSYIFNMLNEMNIQRTLIFTSLSSKDKSVALRLIKRLEDMNVNHWCMYDENGKERNISGDIYTEVISKMLKKCCVFLMLISKHSLASAEVRREIAEVTYTAYNEKYSKLKIIPILINDTSEKDIPEDVVKLSGITSEVIVRRLSLETTENELNEICNEIRSQYIATILENIQQSFIKNNESQIFLNIMDRCVKQKCSVESISNTIKQSREVYTDSLRELHVLSNEMLEFDSNPYCCMVIASNLRGNEVLINKKKDYDPERQGVKYFYYYPESAESEYQTMFEKIKSFIIKDVKSRREVTSLIRKEFCFRNKIATFFSEFNDMTQAQFADHYHIVDEGDYAKFKKLFDDNETQFYFAYADEDDIFQIPDEFVAWLDGDADKFTYNNVISVSYQFISFIGKFVELLENCKDINKVSFETLKKYYQFLIKLQKMEEWQAGNIKLPAAESRRLVNYLLDYTVGAMRKGTRKFPKIANWLNIEYNEDGSIKGLDPKIAEKAFANVVPIKLKNSDDLKLCYSFELFIEDALLTAAWYSVEQYDPTKNDNMVFSYEINRKSELFDDFIKAFKYLVEIHPNAEQILKEKKSRILKIN
ncbi:MAG: TIR domain-containing protein [Clostridiales bacterium]|nr:TIR domain-containing protein [Clostridiales bacterium]